ncbi:TPA: hypothetical protein AB5E57_001615 [Vibrio cholerae]
MTTYVFTGFDIELVPNCPNAPMRLIIKNMAALSIELLSTGVFYVQPSDFGLDHVVMFKMNANTKSTPEISFHIPASEIEQFKKISILPVMS